MGKASRWFRGLLGLNKSESGSSRKPPKEKRRWSFVNCVDNKQAIAVAAATVAATEAAVVRFTASNSIRIRHEWAAVKIQAAFRGCLARKALRALKGLVKLQALVRGHIERKRTAEWLKRMQALVLQTQARVSAGRALQASHSISKSSTSHLHGPATPEKSESPVKSRSMKHQQPPILKRNGSKSCVLINGNQERSGNISETLIDEQSWNNKQAIAVAAATAAMAEAAIAAAQAAAAVVRFTASNSIRIRQEWAAVKIQAAFRGCLARKALRALKGLVKFQALVRGHIERKRTAEWLKRMQALEQPPILKRNGSKSCVLINGNQEKSGNISETFIKEVLLLLLLRVIAQEITLEVILTIQVIWHILNHQRLK